MGLFGKKKTKAPKKVEASDYSPPEVTETDNDAVMVESGASVGSDPSKNESLLADDVEAGDSVDYIAQINDFIDSLGPMKDRAMDRITGTCAALIAFWFSLSKIAQVALVAGGAIGAITIAAVMAAGGRSPAFPAHINVAFVGNSYFYANDLPRFVESIGAGHVTQDSVIHTSADILQVIMTGNGMWQKWATSNAMIHGVKYDTSEGKTEYLYDMGACSVPQLLTGHDEMISPGNSLGTFVNDGNNPCFTQSAYLEYKESTKLKHGWDFVVITDQSKNMALDETRQEALMAFNYTYGPILKKKNISPIIVQPHAYKSANSNGSNDLATFTALIMEGAEVYKKYINKRTGMFSHAHIAPVGNAFLAVYEESPDDIWPKLFLDDGVHPSAYGTFLYGCVIYATMTGYMPKYKKVVIDDMETSPLFASARRLQSSSAQAGFPTKDEAAILFKIAKKVAINGYKPSSLKGFKIEEDSASFLSSSSNYQYQGGYVAGQEYGGNYVYNEYQTYNQYNGGYNNAANQNANNYNENYANNGGNYAGNYGQNDAQANYNNYQGNYQQQANDNYQGNYQQEANDNYQGNYQQEANDNYQGNYQQANDNDNGNYEQEANGNDQGNYEAVQQYYAGKYTNNSGNNNNKNNQANNDNGQYGQGNQNKMQYYYSDLSGDNNN